jgi:hypothetical protein
MISIDFRKLVHSITYYLSYQESIGRDFMIDESSLKYPAADYLTSLEMPLSFIQLEFPHPKLKNRQIDLVTTDALKKKIEIAFEFKISRQNTKYEPEQKRVFNDLMRLQLAGKSNDTPHCYFLIAGRQNDFIQFFRSIVTKKPTGNSNDLAGPEGFYTEWFGFKTNEKKTFAIKESSNDAYKEIYGAFHNEHMDSESHNSLQLPENLTTTCMAISALSREFPTPYVGGIWKVE